MKNLFALTLIICISANIQAQTATVRDIFNRNQTVYIVKGVDNKFAFYSTTTQMNSAIASSLSTVTTAYKLADAKVLKDAKLYTDTSLLTIPELILLPEDGCKLVKNTDGTYSIKAQVVWDAVNNKAIKNPKY